MSKDFKTFLIILVISPVLLMAAVYQLGERNREKASEQQQKAQAKPEQSAEELARKKQEELHFNAIHMAKKFVKDSLKSPRSAKFPWGSDAYNVYALEGEGWENSYEVTGYVDAQNSFGALLRSRFTVQIKDLGSDKWQLIDIQLSE